MIPETVLSSNQQELPEQILLVDDNSSNLKLLSQALEHQGYKLLFAKSGEEALSIAKKAAPELILLDIMMPGLNGYEVCRRLKEDTVTQESAVIFLSALDETTDKVKGLDLGAVDYISKPFQAKEVIARVKTHLTIFRLKKSLSRRNKELEAANSRMKQDLEAAARVQQALLPQRFPESTPWRFAWIYRPCAELAGDSLNVFKIDDRHVCLYVLDVSGHGVPAALLSVTVTRSLSLFADRFSLVTEPSDDPRGYTIVNPAEVARRLNAIYPVLPTLPSATFTYGIGRSPCWYELF